MIKEHINPELSFEPVSKTFARNFMIPFNLYFHPKYFGLENINTKKPAMYVSNHAVLGVFDCFPFGIELYIEKDIILRALVDSNHFKLPIWRDMMSHRLGIVEASRENCLKLMERGESIIVYPGGTREVCKNKGEQYQLKWQHRTGFVQMALQMGYDIVPVAAVGAEDAFEIIMDSHDILDNTKIGGLLKKTGIAKKYLKNGELIPPIIKGVGKTIIPKPVNLYFSFGKRISTNRYKMQFENKEMQEKIKDRVEKALLKQFDELFAIREQDDDRKILQKIFQ